MAAVAQSPATTAHAGSQLDANRLRAAQRLGTRRLDGLVTRQRHAHAALALDFGLAEQAQRRVFLAQRSAEVGEAGLLRIAFDQDDDACQNIIRDPRFIFVKSNFRFLKKKSVSNDENTINPIEKG